MLAHSRTVAGIFLLLIVLAEVVDRDMAATTEQSPMEELTTEDTPMEELTTVDTPMEELTTGDTPMEELTTGDTPMEDLTTADFTTEDITLKSDTTEDLTTQYLTTSASTTNIPTSSISTTNSTPIIPPTTQCTAADMLSLMQERNSLKTEADSLRTAVIVLGVVAGLAVLAAIILFACLVKKRRRLVNKEITTGMFSNSTSNQNKGAATNTNKTTETQFGADTMGINKTVQKTIGSKPAVAERQNANVYVHNKETPRGETKKGRVDNRMSNDQPTEYEIQNEAESSKDNADLIYVNTETDVYEDAKWDLNSSTAHKGHNYIAEGSQNEDIGDSERVYANFNSPTEASGTYSDLEPAQEYSNFYN